MPNETEPTDQTSADRAQLLQGMGQRERERYAKAAAVRLTLEAEDRLAAILDLIDELVVARDALAPPGTYEASAVHASRIGQTIAGLATTAASIRDSYWRVTLPEAVRMLEYWGVDPARTDLDVAGDGD